MNIPKKLIGWWFFLTGFFAFGFVGYLQLEHSPYMWPVALITISFCGAWYALFDYARRLE